MRILMEILVDDKLTVVSKYGVKSNNSLFSLSINCDRKKLEIEKGIFESVYPPFCVKCQVIAIIKTFLYGMDHDHISNDLLNCIDFGQHIIWI